MDREILVSDDNRETHVALLEGGIVVEAAVERHGDRSLVGNVYKSRVNRVLPGMQSAFLDLGLERDGFLHVTDFSLSDGAAQHLAGAQRSEHPPIESLIQEGGTLLVQVVKEAIAGKGARVTGALTFPGRYLVLVPGVLHVGVSRKIEDEEERERLRSLVESMQPTDAGFIVRTAAEGKKEEELQEDLNYLHAIWMQVQRQGEAGRAPALVHTELDRPLQLMRDLFGGRISKILVEGKEVHGRILDFVAAMAPRSTDKVQRYTDPVPLFQARGVRREMDRALRNKVWLKSGGSIVINQTEALVAVDVNTGRFTGKGNLEETIRKTNLEAVKEIVRQLRLRDLGGIIVIDFIDMELEESRVALYQGLEAELDRDRARTYLHALSDFGLIQITRKRSRRSLERILCEPCPTCRGSGRVKSPPTVASEILMELRSTLAEGRTLQLHVRAHPTVVEQIESEQEDFVSSLGIPGCRVTLDGDPSFALEAYRIETPPC